MIEELKADFQVSSPLMTADHEPLKKDDTVRAPAIKGALRFWWRALNWDRVLTSKGNNSQALQQLHQEEADLFGFAAGNSGSQAKVLINVTGTLNEELFARNTISFSGTDNTGITYLMGQGIYNRKDGSKTSGLAGHFTLRCIWRQGTLTREQIDQLQQAIKALGLLGAIGARARKGFGSLSLQALIYNNFPQEIPQDLPGLQQWVSALKRDCQSEVQPPFTALSRKTQCWHLPLKAQGSDITQSLKLLNEYGKEMMRYRLSASSTNGEVTGKGLFKEDARQLRLVVDGKHPTQAPQRAIFGLPHNVFFLDAKTAVEAKPDQHERRASPLLAHVHRFADGKLALIATLIPAQFLPKGEKIVIASNKGGKQISLPFEPDWQTIQRFIDQCAARELTV